MKGHLFAILSAAALAAAGHAQAPLYRAQILPSEIASVGGMNNHGWMVVRMRADQPQHSISLWHPEFGFAHRDVSFPNRRFIAGTVNDSGVVGGVLQSFDWYTQGSSTLHYYWMARVSSDGAVSTYNIDLLTSGSGMSSLANNGDAQYQYQGGTVTFRADGSWRSEIPTGLGVQMNSNGQVLAGYRRHEQNGSFFDFPTTGSGGVLGGDGKAAFQTSLTTGKLFSANGSFIGSFSFDFYGISFAGPDRITGGLSPWVQLPDGFGGFDQEPTLAVWSPLTGRVVVHDALANPIAGLKLAKKNDHYNEVGWMVTQGALNGQTVNVLLTPVPEPATLAALGLGLAAVARRRKMRR